MRITKKLDFDAVYAGTQCRRTKNLTIHARKTKKGQTRIGVSIPKRIGNAVVRNRIKRNIREAFRIAYAALPSGYDIVVTLHNDGKHSKDVYGQLLVSVLQEYDLKCKRM
jgi:ribonuclease P protein component